MQASHVERQFGSKKLILETGKLAKQAHGAVVVQYGDTVTLVTAVEGEADEGRDFFPLVVDYREKTYAAGKFPGGFIKREGRPTTNEILTSRLIDRPIRPLFPTGYFNEVQVMGAVLSADKENDPDVLCLIGSSAALHVSPIPFLKVTGSVRVGRIGNELIVLPTHSQLEESDLDLIVSGTRDAVTMIAAGLALGLPCVAALGKLVQSQLFGVTATDPATIAAAAMILAAGALAAAFIPAWRASNVSHHSVVWIERLRSEGSQPWCRPASVACMVATTGTPNAPRSVAAACATTQSWACTTSGAQERPSAKFRHASRDIASARRQALRRS